MFAIIDVVVFVIALYLDISTCPDIWIKDTHYQCARPGFESCFRLKLNTVFLITAR